MRLIRLESCSNVMILPVGLSGEAIRSKGGLREDVIEDNNSSNQTTVVSPLKNNLFVYI